MGCTTARTRRSFGVPQRRISASPRSSVGTPNDAVVPAGTWVRGAFPVQRGGPSILSASPTARYSGGFDERRTFVIASSMTTATATLIASKFIAGDIGTRVDHAVRASIASSAVMSP